MMIIKSFVCQGQAAFFALFLMASCLSAEKDIPLPSETPPLSYRVLGYGVITASYVRAQSEPGGDGVTLGYAREGDIVTIVERRLIHKGDRTEYWVLIEDKAAGWLPETVLDIYPSEVKARTAARAFAPQ
jgi:hypothetical protein